MQDNREQSIRALFSDNVQERKNAIRNFVMDQSIPYEVRYRVWVDTPRHLQTGEDWVYHHPDLEDEEWMEYDWWNRCQEVNLTDIAYYKEWDDETIKKFYNGCMNDGVWFFNFDW